MPDEESTYTGDPANVPVDAVRINLGREASFDLVTDAEIEYYYALADENAIMAAAYCAEAIAGYFAGMVDKSMGGSSVSLSQKAEAWRKKAAALKALALSPTLYARASSSAAVTKNFAVGQHDYPGSTGVVGDEQW